MLNEKELALMGMAESATAGPWMHLFGDRTVYDRMEDGCRGNAVVRADQPHNAADANNLDFIAAANPASIITLLRELDGARFAAAQRLKTVEQQAAIIAAMSAPIKSAELAELRKLAEAATPGEWTYDENMSPFREAGGEIVGGDGLGHADVYTAYDLPCIVGEQDDDFPPEPRTITEKVALPDARFIAAANPAMILRLLDALAAPAIPAQQQASTDMMPKRAAFIKYCEGRGLDVSVDKDAWGAQIFKPSRPTCRRRL